MPSPFPGMDPYLETPALWPDVHHGLISVIRELLNRQLRPRYSTQIEERVYISDENDPGRSVIIPDVFLVENRPGAVGHTPGPHDANTDIAVAEPIVATTLIDDEIREARVVIMDAAGRSVVTVIEVLSPTNKMVASRGRQSYESKRLEVMHSPSHFVEIDLLRSGMPIWAGERLPPHDYCVRVSKQGERPKGIIWPILLTQRLPVISIPLLPEDTDTTLDLGQVLNTAYDRAGYDVRVDYQKPPLVPLEEPNRSWSRQWLDARPKSGVE